MASLTHGIKSCGTVFLQAVRRLRVSLLQAPGMASVVGGLRSEVTSESYRAVCTRVTDHCASADFL